ncbi:MAG TPA: tyrosine-type recombinase/integrase [Hyphomicrobium sp.]|nr:tyrosine-type recombinase/integrase [Hyphomicrobium sp.]
MARVWFPRSSLRYARSPFGAELQDFADWLDSAGYSRANIGGHARRLFAVLSRSGMKAVRRLPVARLQRLFDPRRMSTCRSHSFRSTERVYARFLKCRGRLLPPSLTGPAASLRQIYSEYLSDVRGFSAPTIEAHLFTVKDFLEETLRGGRALKALTFADVERYLARRSQTVTRQTLQHVIAHLRGFLRYGFSAGLLTRRLDEIDTPRTYRDELPPRALPWAQVTALLRSIDCSSKGGRRDAAVLHLMAYYGLRPSEIATLRLDAIDWQARTVRISQRKTRSDLVLPLMPRTMTLLRGYIKHEREASPIPYLFLRVRRPAGPLMHYGVGDIFHTRAAQSGLPLEGYSSYSLRHSFAMRLLQRNVGVKAIGDLLGHRSLEATCVYLRLDTAALRAVGLPLP